MGLTKYNLDALTNMFSAEDIILVAPLNWGLGHASRCIPVIQWLTTQCKSIIIASDGLALDFLKKEFPNLTFEDLPQYNIRYRYSNIFLNLMSGVFPIVCAVIQEHLVVRKLIKKHSITVVLSDNRLGMYNSRIKSIYITHQINILYPVRWISRIGTKIHRWFISRYDHCLIPDYAGVSALCPELSHGCADNFTYIGPITQIYRQILPVSTDILIILSGPEPQRTYLETDLLKYLTALTSYKIIFIRGTDKPLKFNMDINPNIRIFNLVSKSEIQYHLNSSRLLISRSGYSTVMDISELDIKVIWIPTPGQTEQEYLAESLSHWDKYTYIRQNEIKNIEKYIKLLI